MSRNVIRIRIDREGNVHMEGEGFIGTECDKAMGPIERALGEVTDRRNKHEYARAGAAAQAWEGNGTK